MIEWDQQNYDKHEIHENGNKFKSKDTDLFPTTYEMPIIKIQITSSKSFKKTPCSLFSVPYKNKNLLKI
jgi:hypothetical protein